MSEGNLSFDQETRGVFAAKSARRRDRSFKLSPPPPRFSAWLSALAAVALLVSIAVVSIGQIDTADAQSNTNNAPQFGKSSYSFELEVGSNGTINAVEVGTVTASDADSGDSLTLCAVGSDDTIYALDEYHDAIYTAAEDTAYKNWITTQVSDGDNFGDPNDAVHKTELPRGLLWHDCSLFMMSVKLSGPVLNPTSTSELWKVDIRTGDISSLSLASSFPRGIYGIASVNGKVYGVAEEDGFGTAGTSDDQEAGLYEIDLTANPISAIRVNSSTSADDFGVDERSPRGLTNHSGTLYMVGNRNDALYTLDTSTGAATRYQVNGRDVEYFDPFDNLNTGISACDTNAPGSTSCVADPRGLASFNGKLYLAEYAVGRGHLSEIHLSGVNDGRAERIADGAVPQQNCGLDPSDNRVSCWLDTPTGIVSAPGASPDYFDVSSMGVITYSGPRITQAGQSFNFRVLATDGKGGEGVANITVTTKVPPTPTSIPYVRPDISRVAPAVRSVTVSPGERVRLSVDVYGLQDILNNGFAKDITFEWSVNPSGGSFAEVDPSADADTNANEREVIFTAPTSAGRYSIIAALGPSECDDGDGIRDGCVAEIELTVRRPSQPVEPTPTPANPSGTIPSILTDGEGNQYEVFTPVEGGIFDGGDFSVSAPPGAVPNGEVIGVRVYEAGAASNAGETHQRYTMGGSFHNVAVVDVEGKPVASYRLDTPAKVCLPLPAELSSNISDVAILATNSDNSITVLASAVRLTTSGAGICGNISRLPATLSAGRQGAPAAILAPTPEATPLSPDTGGASPSAVAILWLILLIAAATTVTGLALTARKV